MFVCQIQSIYDKLLLKQMKHGRTCFVPPKWYNPRDKVFFRIFKDNKSFWEMRTIVKRVGNMIYIIYPRFTHKRQLNQLRKCLTDEADSGPPEETVVDVIYGTFDIMALLAALEMHPSKRKRKAIDLIVVNSKRIRYWDQKQIKISQSLSTLNLV